MLPFAIELRPGLPIYEQIVYAVKKAVARGTLGAGERFPSVRTISRELGVNPNTVQKAVGELTNQGVLDVRPGQGCFIGNGTPVTRTEAIRSVRPLVESLVIEAHRAGLGERDLARVLAEEWQRTRKEGA